MLESLAAPSDVPLSLWPGPVRLKNSLTMLQALDLQSLPTSQEVPVLCLERK